MAKQVAPIVAPTSRWRRHRENDQEVGAYTQSSVRQADIFGQVVSVPLSVSALAISSNPEPSGRKRISLRRVRGSPGRVLSFLSTERCAASLCSGKILEMAETSLICGERSVNHILSRQRGKSDVVGMKQPSVEAWTRWRGLLSEQLESGQSAASVLSRAGIGGLGFLRMEEACAGKPKRLSLWKWQ